MLSLPIFRGINYEKVDSISLWYFDGCGIAFCGECGPKHAQVRPRETAPETRKIVPQLEKVFVWICGLTNNAGLIPAGRKNYDQFPHEC
jgi:hypothetical protein